MRDVAYFARKNRETDKMICHPVLLFCHPERSEGSAKVRETNEKAEILRCAQDDEKGTARNDKIGVDIGEIGCFCLGKKSQITTVF